MVCRLPGLTQFSRKVLDCIDIHADWGELGLPWIPQLQAQLPYTDIRMLDSGTRNMPRIVTFPSYGFSSRGLRIRGQLWDVKHRVDLCEVRLKFSDSWHAIKSEALLTGATPREWLDQVRALGGEIFLDTMRMLLQKEYLTLADVIYHSLRKGKILCDTCGNLHFISPDSAESFLTDQGSWCKELL